MENSFKNLINQSGSLLILIPSKSDVDIVSAALSLYLSIREFKDVQISSESPVTVEYNRLIGVNKITQELGNKNLVIRFIDYKADDIERVSYDIENRQFKLTVIPKPGKIAPEKDQIQLSYSGVSSDTVILIGGENESHFPSLSSKEMTNVKILHIGNKSFEAKTKDVLSFAEVSSSVSEIVANIISQNALPLNQDVATNLLAGIENATGNFTDPQVTAITFQIVSQLMQVGGQRGYTRTPSAIEYPEGSIPGQQNASSQVVGEAQADSDDNFENPPSEWLQPKIYKGTGEGGN
jgi:nanoRNase/pAp phosphatase (c-di-AMP/oligoRNAs hydrolase)